MAYKYFRDFDELPIMLTTADLVVLTGFCLKSIQNMCADGRIKAINYGSKERPQYRVPKEWVKNLIEGQR